MIAWGYSPAVPAARRKSCPEHHQNGPPKPDMPEQRLPIIGTGSQTTPTEAVLRAGLDAAGLDVLVEHWEPRPHLLAEAIVRLRGREYLGALVIAPHKERAAALLGSLSDDARLSGAVNVIVREGGRLRGRNTDMDGIRAGLAAILPRVQGRWPRVAVVLGAGGGARAAVAVLIGSGFQHVAVFNRHLHKAEALVAHFARGARHMELRARPWHETILEAEVSRAGLVIDASGLGADEAASSISPEALPDGLFVLDLALHRAATPLMREAKTRGATVANGQVSFLAAQVAAFRLWTGKEPPTDVLREALSSVLGSANLEVAVTGD
jgi:shikimate dehydrogenase